MAGGLAAAAFAVPTNAATVNGASISQNQLNSDVTAIATSTDYQCFLNAEEYVGTEGQVDALPTVAGVGPTSAGGPYTAATTAFVSTYLDTDIGHQLVLELAAKRHIVVTKADLTTARTEFLAQISSVFQTVQSNQAQVCALTALPSAKEVLASVPPSFVATTVRFDATVSLLEESVSGVGTSTADLERYFNANSALFDNACFTVAEYTSESDAKAAAAQVTAGTPFAQVASAAGGGPQGCYILYGIASEFPAGTNLQKLAVNQVSAPIDEQSTYLLVQITKLTPNLFVAAKSEVEGAVQSAGSAKTRTVINAAEKSGDITVDPRYGTWVPAEVQVEIPPSPVTADVLNPTVNSGAVASSTPVTGQSG
jgi:hypothetical protein